MCVCLVWWLVETHCLCVTLLAFLCVCREMEHNGVLSDRAIPNSISNDAFLPGGGSVTCTHV